MKKSTAKKPTEKKETKPTPKAKTPPPAKEAKTPPPVEKKAPAVSIQKYECTVCGYIYDPVKGDPDGGVAPNTPFDKIPDDWVCPICSASKGDFEPIY